MAEKSNSSEGGSGSMGKGIPPVTVSIYQNPDYVEGILQQVYQQPLYTERVESVERAEAESRDSTNRGEASVSAAAKFGPLARMEGSLGGGLERADRTSVSGGSTTSSSARFTQAYYLHAAVSALESIGAITDVEDVDQARTLDVGDFVRFSAVFEPSQIVSILDIATPDLVGGLVRHFVRRSSLTGDKHAAANNDKSVAAAVLRAGDIADSWASVAKAATEAVKIDFRSPSTREYYGRIGESESAVTAVTICDVANFVVDDEDRILDGKFTVLGKITSGCVENEPVLARNKLLNRLNPEAVDELVSTLNSEVVRQEETAKAHVEAPFRFKLDSRIQGTSFKVIPIAIYL